jgi:lysophospholipase L1-like esterase
MLVPKQSGIRITATGTEPDGMTAAQFAQTKAMVSAAWNDTMVGLGDSLTARSNVASGGAQNAQGTSFLAWAAALMGAAFTWLNAGISGNTTAQMLARYATDVTPLSGRWLHLLGGGNDVSADVSASAIIANLTQIIALAKGEGRQIVLGTIYPFTSHTTTARRAAIAGVNAWIRAQGAAGTVIVADYYSAMVDQAGAIRSGLLVSDAIHPSIQGASVMGRALASALTARVGPRTHILSASQLDADNACQNGCMSGANASGANGWSVAGGVTGTGPRGWSVTSTGAIVAVASKQARTGNASAADFARVAITTSGVDDSYVRYERAVNYRVWSSSGTANTVRRFYVPATGAQYDVLVDGSLSATDLTATWPTDIGATFTDGTATLMCVQPIVPGSVLRMAVECNISGVSVGQVHPEVMVFCRNTAAATVCNTLGLATAGVAVDAAAALVSESGSGLVIETNDVTVPATFDLAGATSAAGPSIVVRLNLYVRNSALATIDWGRATVRVR